MISPHILALEKSVFGKKVLSLRGVKQFGGAGSREGQFRCMEKTEAELSYLELKLEMFVPSMIKGPSVL